MRNSILFTFLFPFHKNRAYINLIVMLTVLEVNLCFYDNNKRQRKFHHHFFEQINDLNIG